MERIRSCVNTKLERYGPQPDVVIFFLLSLSKEFNVYTITNPFNPGLTIPGPQVLNDKPKSFHWLGGGGHQEFGNQAKGLILGKFGCQCHFEL
jgi:hypothetical protein